VLSVGDSQFQDKCLKKLNDLGTTGRTILYVSHDISTVLNICNKGIFLEKGVLKQSGAIDDCVSEYVRSCKLWSMHWEGDFGDEHIRFYRASLRSDSYNKDFFYQGESVTIEMEYEILKPLAELSLGITIWNTRNQLLARSRMDNDSEHLVKFLSHGKQKIYLTFDSALFHEGEYLIKIESGIYNNKIIFDDEIVLKLPIYSPNKNMRFSHLIPRDGVLLGNQWKQL
jgi:lipopolysaccharide transport system ATP-binding protein